MEHDMTEQKREPKDSEWWWVYLFEETNPSIAQYTNIAQHTNDEYGPGWYLSGDDWILRLASAAPIAPVASHELVRELVEALDEIVPVLLRNRLGGKANRIIAALAKAHAAGLGGK